MKRAAIFCAAVLALGLPGGAAVRAVENSLPADPRAEDRLENDERQLLAAIARNAATGARLGAMGEARLNGTPMAELGRSLAQTHSALEHNLFVLAGPQNMPLRERLDTRMVERMQALSRTDRAASAGLLRDWVARNHPETMRAMGELARRNSRFAPLADVALPVLRQQLGAVQAGLGAPPG